jgi:Gpi18-like mannosyltransferase
MTIAHTLPRVDTNPAGLLPVVVVLGTIFVHWIFWDVPSPDVEHFLQHWYGHLSDKGLVQGFSAPFGNYSPPYLYLLGLATLTEPWLSIHDAIRLLSVAGSLLLAAAVYRLMLASGAEQPWRGALWTPLLPSVFANAGLMSQCDALWVAPCLLAVAAALDRRHAAMLGWAGLAFAVKGQAAFLAPFLFALLIRRRVPLGLWLIPPAVFALMMVPAWAAGWPALDLALTYVHQSAQKPGFISNAPNLWTLFNVFAPGLGQVLVPFGFALGAFGALRAAWWLAPRLNTGPRLIEGALFASLLVPTLLPKMHERYFLLADMLAFVLALTLRDARSLGIAVLTIGGSVIAITGYVAQSWLVTAASSLPTTIAVLLVWRSLRGAAATG